MRTVQSIFLISSLLVVWTRCDGTYDLSTDEPVEIPDTAATVPADPSRLRSGSVVTVPSRQQAGDSFGLNEEDRKIFNSLTGGLKVSFKMSGITKLELESVDGNTLAGHSVLAETDSGLGLGAVTEAASIITFLSADGSPLQPDTDYYIVTFPCDLYWGYRLSIFKDGKVAHFYCVHQNVEAGRFVSPLQLAENELVFDELDAPLVEEERPELDGVTRDLLKKYKDDGSKENYDALYEQMIFRYDKVVARKKAKLRELEREAKHQSLVDEMQDIVDEMVSNRDERIRQRFLSIIDSRRDDNRNDEWLVLKGSPDNNAYVGYAPVTNAEYAGFDKDFVFPEGQERFPVVNVSLREAQAYCDWLSSGDPRHIYRIPTDYEWILAAGHMPKDVLMNSNHEHDGLTSVDDYSMSVGICGGIDFWGNCWEWTETRDDSGQCIVKGGAWDSKRNDCRSEYSGTSRRPEKGYPDVGFRVVRVDS